MDSFGFSVRRTEHYDRTAGAMVKDEPPAWVVYLPHQCSSWCVVGDHAYAATDDGVEHGEAVVTMERFVAEAQAALDALRDSHDGFGPGD